MAEITPPTPMPKYVFEALKEVARLIVFAIPAIVIQVVSSNPGIAETAIGGILLLLLRGIDRGIHENPKVESNGLVPF